MAVETPICDFGWPAPDFALKGLDGKIYGLEQIKGPRGTLVMLICNHCPYVKAIIDRLVVDAKELQTQGIGVAAIMSNDVSAYPEDRPEKMQEFAAQHGFSFPYLYDADQTVARAYGAVCTPDFFGFDANLGLQYRGRLDASRKEAAPPDAKRELFEAMQAVAKTGKGPILQTPSMGCSIKWKTQD